MTGAITICGIEYLPVFTRGTGCDGKPCLTLTSLATSPDVCCGDDPSESVAASITISGTEYTGTLAIGAGPVWEGEVTVSPPPPLACFNTTTTTPATIPASDPAGVALSFTVSGRGTSEVPSRLTLAISHPQIGHLTCTLTDPHANSVVVLDQLPLGAGTSTGTSIDVTLQTGAGTNIQLQGGSGDVSGTYDPANPFSGFSGDPNGTWTLKVLDTVSVDPGTVDATSICFGEGA